MLVMAISREWTMEALIFSFHLFILSEFSIINMYQLRKNTSKGVDSLHPSDLTDLNLATHDNYKNNKEG